MIPISETCNHDLIDFGEYWKEHYKSDRPDLADDYRDRVRAGEKPESVIEDIKDEVAEEMERSKSLVREP